MDYPPDATFYVRLSLMTPREGMGDQVLELHRKLLEWLPGHPGYVRGYLILSGDPYERVGHLDVWRTGPDADRAAQTDHVLSLRAELLLLVDEESHAEHSYTAVDPELAKKLRS
jgi:hypothetical protein